VEISRNLCSERLKCIGRSSLRTVGVRAIEAIVRLDPQHVNPRKLEGFIEIDTHDKAIPKGKVRIAGRTPVAILMKCKDLRFQFGIRIKENGAGDVPKLVGSVVQGPAGARFVYLDIGTYASQTETCWNRRLKVPLSGITWDMIDRLADDSLTVLATRVPGTGRDGGPNCGTVKPFHGWKVVLAAID
jgi:Family of unknown function (DUF5990)